MARRRASRSRRFKMGRQGLWIRHEVFIPSNVVTAPLLTEDAVVFPDQWERVSEDTSQPKYGAGGPVLQRVFGSCIWEIDEADSANTILAPNFEVLVFIASTQEPAATAAGDFAANLENQRVLHYSTMGPQVYARVPTATSLRWNATLRFDSKAKARLAGNDVVVMTRCSESETASVTIRARLQVSAYLTTP